MTNKIFYKKLNSFNQSINGVSEWRVAYKVNEWAYPLPETDGLFVFDTLENARSFPYGNLIYECEVINPRIIKIIYDIPNSSLSHKHCMKMFWKLRRQHKKIKDAPLRKSPKGTYLCDGVKITKLVDTW